MNCPTCDGTKIISTELLSRDNFNLKINKCQNCGHFFQNLDQYEDVYSTGEFSVKARKSLEPTQEKIKELDKRAGERIGFYKDFLSRHHEVLEVGSSIGSFLHLLKISGKSITGLEPDPVYASFSEKQYFFKQDTGMFEEFQPKRKFDLICSFHVIEHIQYLDRFIEKSYQLLDENGALLIECPSLDLHSYGDMKLTIWKPHMHYFTLASMYALLANKFDVVSLGYYGMSVYVYAVKDEKARFNESKFKKYKSRGQTTRKVINYTPAINLFKLEKSKFRQLVLQPFLQRNTKEKLRRYTTLAGFGLKAIAYKKNEEKPLHKKATHVSYYRAWENAGDTVLSQCVRKVFNSRFNNGWNLKGVNNPVSGKVISEVNKSKYLLIGGGGLLLPDSNKNTISGWQWAVSKDQLKEIEVPVVVYAIGYNFFKGQKPGDLFIENLNRLIDRANFFSLRNHGSIQKVKELIDPSLVNKVIYQPCPTTVISKFYNLNTNKIPKSVGVNLAFDRYEKRFGENIYQILDELAKFLKEIEKEGYKIYYINHLKGDEKFELVLEKFKIKYQSVNLQYTLPKETIDFYSKLEIVLGARGHAQMIPFGVGTRIISLGTHNKLKYFLEDIDAVDWFVDLTEKPERLSNTLTETFFKINEEKANLIDQYISVKQEELYRITLDNLEKINDILGS